MYIKMYNAAKKCMLFRCFLKVDFYTCLLKEAILVVLKGKNKFQEVFCMENEKLLASVHIYV